VVNKGIMLREGGILLGSASRSKRVKKALALAKIAAAITREMLRKMRLMVRITS
jgi:hypothetical protein